SQCPYGSVSPPKPLKLDLWDCPLGLKAVELSEPIEPLAFQVDCAKKMIDVHPSNKSLPHTTWEALPDGHFYFSVDAGTVKFKKDGSGNTDCAAPITAEMWGQLECKDRDRVTIRMETIWRISKFTTRYS